MERLMLACGGTQVNSTDDLDRGSLGFAGRVYEQTLGDEKYTFVEDVRHPRSCTILIKGPNNYTIEQIKDAVRDGLRAVKNVIIDGAVIPGGGAFEIAAAESLMRFKRDEIRGRAKIGVQAFADALLIIPKVREAGAWGNERDVVRPRLPHKGSQTLTMLECLIQLEEEHRNRGVAVGLDVNTGEPMLPDQEGIWDSYSVKRQCLHLCTILATQILLVDEVMRAGAQMGGKPPMNPEDGME
eukprot:scaffold1234_cov248-Pinguiococcus_pyrenoidosus.AAC.9